MTKGSTGVLVVEDDERTAAFIADNLRADGFRVAVASDAGEAVRAIEVRRPSMVVLDLSLGSGTSGLAVLDRVRSADGLGTRIDPALPVIILSGHGGDIDRLRGLQRGADDYVVKPFMYAELLERVRAVLRRSSGRPGGGALVVGELSLDPSSRDVRVGDREVVLSAKEFALLHALASEPTRVVPKAELLREGTPDRNGVGALRRLVAGPLQFTEEITVFERPARMDYMIREVNLPLEHDGGSITLAPDGAGTQVHWISVFTMPVPVVGGAMAAGFAVALRRGFIRLLDDIDRLA
jgi:DNA-binding response OmpR family regulator